MPTDRDVTHIDTPTPARVSKPADGKGSLILIGGSCSPTGHALGSFLDLSRACDGERIVALTTASSVPEENAWYWSGAFRSVGAMNVEIPMFDKSKPRIDAEIAERIDGATGVFLGGGDQVKLVTALSGTKTCAAIRACYQRGGAVCGTSAGAAALTQLTMAGGETDEEGNLIDQYLGPGLGLLGYDTIVDTHFSQRRRLQRLFLVVASNRQLFGIGIDEDTALVVRDHIGKVVGAGGVTFVDGRDTVRFDNAHELDKGRQLTLSHLRVGIVGTKYHLDLHARELHELLTGVAPQHHVAAD